MLRISTVLPCLNEAHNLPAVLRVLREAARRYPYDVEICVVDGGSEDGTLGSAPPCPLEVERVRTRPSRAVQLNAGAAATSADILYFVHADSRPPRSCYADVCAAVQGGAQLGGYPFEFDSPDLLLRVNSWLTGFNTLSFRGGDQSIFITRALFERIGGFREEMVLMEEYDLLRRASATGAAYTLLPGRTLVSARKYEGRSWARVQTANVRAMLQWRAGTPTERIRRDYEALLKH